MLGQVNGSESIYRGLLEAAPDAIVGVTQGGTITFVNAQTESLFGYSRDELLGQPIEMLVPETARSVHPHHRDAYFTAPQTRPMGAGMELAGRRKDGTEFPAEISLSSFQTEEGLLVAAAIRDGTDRRQAAIVSSSSHAIISRDLAGTITSWNPGAETMYGYRAGEIIGRDFTDLVQPARIDAERAAHARAVLGAQVTEYDVVHVRADGSEIDVATTISPIIDAAGTTVGVSTFSRDITGRMRIEAERQKLETRLHQSERLESLGQLAGGVAHDFNNLLSVILNYAAFVAEELADNDAVRADVEEIQLAAERAARLTHQLLIFGRRETSRPEILDLDAVVADVQNLLSRTLGEHIHLDVRTSATPPVLRVDRGQLEQVLVNLAVNARDAMPEGGSLTIETAMVAFDLESSRRHPGAPPGRYVQLSVSDTGTGMSRDVVDHVFEPFFTTKPAGEGTGLGLATVYGIVLEAAGTIDIYSEPGMGTTVRVYLPTVAGQVTTVEAGRARPRNVGAGETILVVEDEAAILKVTARILRRNGYHVLEAASGPEAIAIATDQHFDVLLTDVVMPAMSGTELVEQIRPIRPDARILFMSGYSRGVLSPQRALDDDVALIQKPFSEDMLIERLLSLGDDH